MEQEPTEDIDTDPVSVTAWDYVKMIFALLFVSVITLWSITVCK